MRRIGKKREAAKQPTIERQELHCHNCDKYVQFDLDTSLEGQHILECPNCGHKHYRIVKNGEITDSRWGQDPSQVATYYISTANVTCTGTSTYSNYYGNNSSTGSCSYYLYGAWQNSATTC